MEAELLRGRSRNEQIGTIWKYLDELAQNDPEKYSEFIKTTLEDGAKEGLGPPMSKFVIRTQKIPRMIPVRDFFINACQWVQIPGPTSSSEPIKMIASDLREELIQNRMCFTIDVAVNDGVMEQCLGSKEEKSMLIDLMIRYVEATNSCKLDANYNIFDQEYMGNRDNLLDMMCPVSLREAARESSSGFSEEKLIKGLQKMTAEEAKEGGELNIGRHGEFKDESSNIILPSHVNVKNEVFLSESSMEETKDNRQMESSGEKVTTCLIDGSTVEARDSIKKIGLREPIYARRSEVNGQDIFEIIEVDLPGVSNINDCDLDVGQDFLNLEVPQRFALNLSLNSRVDEDHTKAYFIRKDEKLVIRIKFVNG